MNTDLRHFGLGTLLLAVTSGAAWADGVATYDYAPPNYSGGGGGGAFQITPLAGVDPYTGLDYYSGETGGNGGSSSTFLTFCLETGESFTPGATYYTQIATSAVGGGSSYDPSTRETAPAGSDPINEITAAIYLEFRAGGDFGTSLAPDSPAYCAAVQQAIWYSEGEISNPNADALTMYTFASNNNYGDLQSVRVLRTWTSYVDGVYSGNAQDMLTLVPLPPAAYAGMVTMAGLLGLGFIRRQRLAAN